MAKHERLDKLGQSILEITQAIIGTENSEDLYNLILKKSIEAVPNANVGSIMICGEDNLFRCIAYKGFDEDKIKDFELPLEETILWKTAEGNISTSVIVNDVTELDGLEIKPLSVDPHDWTIRSCIAVPLFSDEKVKGIVSIDSKDLNAFTESDKQTMEQIRGNLEIALQKFLLYQKMVNLSRYDSLTTAYNRNFFMDHFEYTLNRAERYQQKFALVIFDIDDLKVVNDSAGHLAGDKILKDFAETTLSSIRKSDTFARWGGDEFMAIFYEINEERISEKVVSIQDKLKGKVSFSFGHAFFPDEGDSFDSLLRIADNRMYMDKKKNKADKSSS